MSVSAETGSAETGAEAPTPSGPEPTAGAARRKRRWRKPLLLAGGALLLVGAGFALLRKEPAPAASAPSSDTPRAEGDRIRFSESYAKRAGLRFQRVRLAELVPVVETIGTADFDSMHVAAVGAGIRGLVSRVQKFEGDAVKAGEVLATIESAELGEAQARVRTLSADLEAAQLNAEREAKLLERQLTTAREAERAAVEAHRVALELKAAKQKLSALAGGRKVATDSAFGTHSLRSPIDGTVVDRAVAPGQFVESHIVAFKVANLDYLWIELDVFERHLHRIKVGDSARIQPLAGGIGPIEGVVAKIGTNIDPETHSAHVRIEVDNRNRRLRAGQAVRATIQAGAAKKTAALLVPTPAVVYVDGSPLLFVALGPTLVRVARVRLGPSDEDETEIVEGIAETDEVVVSGAAALKGELFR